MTVYGSDIFKTTISAATAFAFAVYQVGAALPDTQIANAHYAGFVSTVQQYRWQKGLLALGAGSEARLAELAYAVMTHAGKPKAFSLADLGEPDCGLPGGGHEHNGTSACHAVCRNDEDDEDCPFKKGPQVS